MGGWLGSNRIQLCILEFQLRDFALADFVFRRLQRRTGAMKSASAYTAALNRRWNRWPFRGAPATAHELSPLPPLQVSPDPPLLHESLEPLELLSHEPLELEPDPESAEHPLESDDPVELGSEAQLSVGVES